VTVDLHTKAFVGKETSLRILWVKSGGLLPLDTGGKIRSYHLLKELARRHTVELFIFYPEHAGDVHAQLNRHCRRVISLPLPIAPPRSLADYERYVRNLFSLQPYAVAKYCRIEVKEKLRQLLSQESYDIIVCDFLLTAAVFPSTLPCPMVIFTHNVEAQIWQRHYKVSKNPIWKAVSWREYQTMARLERRQLQRADFVLAVSENDRNFFERIVDPTKIAVIQTGVDTDYFYPSQEPELPNTLVFTGSMDWLPNEDAIFYFVEKILPHIRRDIPDVTLWVVGRNPSRRLLALTDRERGLRITGTVEDIRPYIRKSAVYVVPLRIGGGTRIKIFQAMAEGKAVVSTSIGAEGLPIEHGENILLADQPAHFADQVVSLLNDEVKRKKLGKAARQLVEQNYSWSRVADDLASVLASAAGRSINDSGEKKGGSNPREDATAVRAHD
jgi:sugar transferase (PEP-CTERM/EpsH1 system associated)